MLSPRSAKLFEKCHVIVLLKEVAVMCCLHDQQELFGCARIHATTPCEVA